MMKPKFLTTIYINGCIMDLYPPKPGWQQNELVCIRLNSTQIGER